jgi:triosephosphate isomerase
MRKKIVAGNWKMNLDLSETESLITELKEYLPNEPVAEIVLAPPFTNLYSVFSDFRETSVKVAAQNMHQEENGAFTGEISAKMLKSVGAKSVILGHSERREYFGEDNALLAKKTDTALKNEMTVIFCVGEQLEQRQENTHFDLVEKQLKEGLFHLDENSWKNIVIAYEPVWAIGTGETASPEQAQEMHAFIRKTLASKYGEKIAEGVSILYGGSVKPGNAKDIFSQKDVDGGLIGGASLKGADFAEIVMACK